MSNEYFTVGVITQPHGLRGEVKVYPRTDFPEKRFTKGSHLYVRKEGQSPFAEVVVRQGRPHQQMWIVAFTGLNNISDIEAWKGMQLCVHESQLEPLPEGTYYFHQLIGLQVRADDGTYVGELVEVLTPGANDVYVVRGPLQASDVLLPAIPSCILGVDLQQKVMTVHLLPGLLERDHASDDETSAGEH